MRSSLSSRLSLDAATSCTVFELLAYVDSEGSMAASPGDLLLAGLIRAVPFGRSSAVKGCGGGLRSAADKVLFLLVLTSPPLLTRGYVFVGGSLGALWEDEEYDVKSTGGGPYDDVGGSSKCSGSRPFSGRS
jgi:hypothetical protein